MENNAQKTSVGQEPTASHKDFGLVGPLYLSSATIKHYVLLEVKVV